MKNVYLLITSVMLLFGCTTQRNVSKLNDDGKLEVVFIQVNDVYEIAPIAGGKEGGMARVATLKKWYSKQNPNTFLVMAGDFLSPSVYNSLQNNGRRIRGQQMVESMNAAGTDFAMFGNHEFDINEAELQSRLNESTFDWISSNAFHKTSENVVPFRRTSGTKLSPFPRYRILDLRDADGTKVRLGLFALTLPYNKPPYVSYTDPFETASEMYALLKDSCDAVVAITHQAIEDDIKLANQLPGLSLIIGGHEHDMRFQQVGNVYITKAHANARSAYLIRVAVNKQAKKVEINPELKMLDASVPLDSATSVVVEKWMNVADQNYSSLGFDARKVVVQQGDSLDGREIYTRSRSTNLTDIIMRSMAAAAPEADVVVMNGGSIRVDDILFTPITQFDILRALPYGGSIREVDMKGSLLTKVLNTGLTNITGGGYLHSFPTSFDSVSKVWKIRNEEIVPGKSYRVAFSDFLISGLEQNLDYLNVKNPEILNVYPEEKNVTNPKSDIRLAIIKYLQKSR